MNKINLKEHAWQFEETQRPPNRFVYLDIFTCSRCISSRGVLVTVGMRRGSDQREDIVFPNDPRFVLDTMFEKFGL